MSKEDKRSAKLELFKVEKHDNGGYTVESMPGGRRGENLGDRPVPTGAFSNAADMVSFLADQLGVQVEAKKPSVIIGTVSPKEYMDSQIQNRKLSEPTQAKSFEKGAVEAAAHELEDLVKVICDHDTLIQPVPHADAWRIALLNARAALLKYSEILD